MRRIVGREILGICEGAKEDKSGWSAFLRHLVDRGLNGVLRDALHQAAAGIGNDQLHDLPEARWQRCMVGSLKNVAATAVYAATSCCRLQPRVSAVSADLAPNIRILNAIETRISAQNAAASRLRLITAAVR
jgi:transposase-like protein